MDQLRVHSPALPVRKASPTLDRSLFFASLSLLTFSTLTAIALGAWFTSVEDAWTWKSTVAVLACLGGVVTSFLVWRMPTRAVLGAGAGVMLFSLLRVADVADWRNLSFLVVGSTVVLAIPVIYAFVVLPRG
jgi:hypothetical protein